MEQVPQHRLTWPALLEHPFVKDTPAEIEVRAGILFAKFRFSSIDLRFSIIIYPCNYLFDLQ